MLPIKQKSMNFYQFISILWSRKCVVLSVMMVTIITTLVLSLLLPKQYVATTSILVDQHGVDPVTGLSLPRQVLPPNNATESDIIASHNVALKVVKKLNLNEDPQMQKGFIKAGGTGDISDWIADLLLKNNLEIKPSRESSLIQLNFTSIDPKFSMIAANAFADAYIETSIELRSQPVKLNAGLFHSQMTYLRDHLEHAQSVLSNYQQQQGIVATDDRLDLENARLTDLSKQLVDSQLHTSELQSRKNLLSTTVEQGGSLESLQEVLNSVLIQSLKSDLSRAESKFAELSKRVDVRHPQYMESKAEVNSIKQKIHSEIKMILNSIESGLTSASQRDKMIANALTEQKVKVLELKKQHNEMAVLNREVESAQRTYDAAMQRAVQSRMESEMSQTNISVLNPAFLPHKPAKPKIMLNIMLSVFLGSMLGVGSALVAELMDRRVRSTFDISDALVIPVFAVVSTSVAKRKLISPLLNVDKALGFLNDQRSI